MGQINERIKQLESQIADLQSKLQVLLDGIEVKYPTLISRVVAQDNTQVGSVDIKVGLGDKMGSGIIWNTSELSKPPINIEPTNPEFTSGAKGYNKHSHSRFSGGALIKDALEIVEYVWGTITNKHSQQFWPTEPKIATEINSNGETVDKIGKLDLIFNPDIIKWGCSSYEIDIKKCYLVERDINGDIVLDSKGQEKKSPLYNADQTKTSVVWDENSGCFRFYATYAPGV